MKLSLFFTLLLLLASCSLLEKFKTPNNSQKSSSNPSSSYGDQVRKRLIQNIPNLQFCLEKFLPPTESGTFKGSVTFSFAINRFGMVRNVAVTSDQLRNIKAKGCMVKTITTIEMPNHASKKDFKMKQPIGITMSEN